MRGRKCKISTILISIILLLSLLSIIVSSNKNIVLNDRNFLAYADKLNFNLDGKILYVGGSGPSNYSNIYSALNDAEDGDTIYVYSGIYHESLKIFKEIELIGENKNTTILDTWASSPSALIGSNNVKINCFTIQNSYSNIISIENSDNFTLCNNIIIYKKDYFGGGEIYLENSNNNTITDNYMIKTGFYLKKSYNNTIDNNMVNEKPIVYLEGKSNEIINDGGQVILIRCNNIKVQHLNLSNIRVGVQLIESNNCYIFNNSFNHSYYGGIELQSSNHNMIDGNNFLEDDMKLDSSNGNTITNNILSNFYNNNFRLSNYNIIKNNKIISNQYGLTFYYSNFNIIEENIFLNNDYGYYQIYSNNNTVINNNFDDNNYGIKINSGFDNYVSNNTLTCNYKGISFSSCSNNIIIENHCKDNIYGISLSSGINNSILSNSFYKDGLFITSTHNYVNNNTVNDKPVVYLENVANKIITGNAGQVILVECESIVIQNMEITNTSHGIQLSYSNNCTINNNILKHNYNNLYCYKSNYNTIKTNTFTSGVIGINFRYSDNNNIIDNVCLNNNNEQYKHPISGYDSSRSGINFYYCDNNIIKENDCSDNYVGIYIQSFSDNNIVEKNIIKNCNYSIKLRTNSDYNLIYYNHFENNIVGISLDVVSYNRIIKNNFIMIVKELYLNIYVYYDWHKPLDIIENYWNKPRFFPKLFIGELTYIYADIPWGRHFSVWPYLDWHPAQEPYNI